MGNGLAGKALLGLRAAAAVLMIAGFLAGGARAAAARTSDAGIDGNTYTGQYFDWSVEWDEDVWAEAHAVDKDDADMLMLTLLTAGGDILGAATLFATPSFSGDVGACTDDYDDVWLETRDSVSDVAETTEVDLPRAPRGQANAAYSYTMDFEDGSSLDLIDYVQCRTLIDGDAVLAAWVTARPGGYDRAVPEFQDLLEAVEVEEVAESTQSGIDGDTYESPTYGFTVEWDDRIWEVDAEEEVVGSGHERLDRIAWYGEGSYLEIEARTAFDGDSADCLEDRIEAMEDDDTLVDAEPLEDRRGHPVEGETEAGGEYVAYVLTFENEDGSEQETVQYFECRILEDGESVLIFSLLAYPETYEDELEAAEEIFDSIEV